MLFHDLNGGSIVAGVFDPSLAKAREFRVHLGFPCKPVEGGEEEEGKKRRVTLDREALLEGVKRIGGGLVERIELH